MENKKTVNSRKFIINAYVFGLTLTLFQFNNCSDVKFAPSPVESMTLKSSAFFDPRNNVDGVLEAEGLPIENLRVETKEQASAKFVKDCTLPVQVGSLTMDRKSWERGEALKAAMDDPDKKTVPVEYAISFGQKEDRLAVWGHKRAILSESNPGHSIIPVGLKNSSVYVKPGTSTHLHSYYKANHDSAKNQYKNGERCFYSTVKISSDLVSSHRYDFIEAVETGEDKASLRHGIHYMYYGYCAGCAPNSALYGAGHYGASGAPNRLFGEWPHNEVNTASNQSELQFVKLYVADLRDGQFRLGRAGEVVQDPENALRGHESMIDVREHVNLTLIFENFGQAVRNLSSSYISVGGEVFSGMVGVPQLLSNLNNLSVNGTLLASQYTPIVLDLGSSKVRTTSASSGTFFNMAALEKRDVASLDSMKVPHRTAWLGGEIQDVGSIVSFDGRGFAKDFRRISDDGFLVIPDSDGKVRSSKNLFGDRMEVSGQTFENGFLALQALAGKNCLSEDIRQRYLGPWDGDKYDSIIKVWVDHDRNGTASSTELLSLRTAGVAAINVCNIIHAQDKDAYGNGTALRSAFLALSPGEMVSEDEILTRIETGKTSAGKNADFRLAIDLIFKVQEKATLEKVVLK